MTITSCTIMKLLKKKSYTRRLSICLLGSFEREKKLKVVNTVILTGLIKPNLKNHIYVFEHMSSCIIK